jgi:large subunit ribosomal protein L24
MKIKKNDQVLIMKGKDRGKKGKVLDVFPREGRLVVEGVNIRKKHVRAKRTGEKGQIVETPAPLNVANVRLICPKCGQPAKVGRKITEKKKYRVCKKCGQEI